MTTIAGQLNNFNNLLYNTKRRAVNDYLEHKAGREREKEKREKEGERER